VLVLFDQTVFGELAQGVNHGTARHFDLLG
jgi:hypothetical protein